MEHCTEDVLNTVSQLSSYNEIATKLLNERFILTALELHAELCEAGTELPILKDYFGNPNNFENQNLKPESCIPIIRSSSQATLDSLDMARYSEDGIGTDERVAVLEFELRKARENISALRANLTVITESESTSPDKVTDKVQLIDSPIKPHEQRALNFLVNEYLLMQSYKLTSITFSDENENQDFEDWEDVGLNIPKPSNLLQIYREYYRKNDCEKALSIDVSVQVHLDDSIIGETNDIICDKMETHRNNLSVVDELKYLKRQIESLEQDKSNLIQRLEAININQCVIVDNTTQIVETILPSNATTPDKFEIVESPHHESYTTDQKADDEDDSIFAALSLGDTGDADTAEKDWMRIQLPATHETAKSPSIDVNLHAHHIPELFKKQLFTYSLINTFHDDDAKDFLIYNYDRTLESLINLLSTVLPMIIPYIALNKRDQVVPLILAAITMNHDTTQRDKLLQLLFNLKKKPQQGEREMLLKALVSLVKINDGPIEPEEIITVCWEQSQHKYPEKRLLVIECCSALAPYTSSNIKNSLMISMLQQMLIEDKDPIVRTSVIRTLALLVAFNDDPDKYFQCEELALIALDDESLHVFDITVEVLLPILAQWALLLKRLLSQLFMRIISKLKNLLKSDAHSSGSDHRSSEKAVRLINVLKTLLPHMIVCVVNNSTVNSQVSEDTPVELPEQLLQLCSSALTNPLVFFEDGQNIVKLINTFLINNWENNMWPELEWLNNKLFSDIIMMIKILSTSQEIVLNNLLTYIESLCSGFGRYVVLYWIKNILDNEILELERHLIDSCRDSNRSHSHLSLIPAYILTLSTVNMLELPGRLKHFIVAVSNSGADITCLIITIKVLLKRCENIDQIIGVLWDGVVHQSVNVRSTTATLFSNIIENIPEQIVTARVAPAIITLASDSDILVKAAAVTALGKLITDCAAKEAKDKGRLTLESIIMEMDGNIVTQNLSIPLISTFANIAQNSPQRYVEDVIATQVTKTSALALQQNSGVGLTIALLDAYSILVYCCLNAQCITNVLLPGLGFLQSLVNQQLPHQNENVQTLIRETESRLNSIKSAERPSSANSGLSLSLTASNVGQGVEDMRQRMTKIFTPKSHSPNLPSIFRKK